MKEITQSQAQEMVKALKAVRTWLLFDKEIIEPNNWNQNFVEANNLVNKVLKDIREE